MTSPYGSEDDDPEAAAKQFTAGTRPGVEALRAAFAKHYDPWAPNAEPKYFPK